MTFLKRRLQSIEQEQMSLLYRITAVHECGNEVLANELSDKMAALVDCEMGLRFHIHSLEQAEEMELMAIEDCLPKEYVAERRSRHD